MSKSTLSIFTEKTGPGGGFDYTVVNKLLGSPNNVDDLSLFVRESAQNAWDARLKPNGNSDAHFDISIGVFSESNAAAFLHEALVAEKETADLRAALVSATSFGCPYLIVRDSGTVGLAGATEADEPSGRRNFISFVRNIGQDTHDTNSGGSFGFGKSVFFRYSDQRTIFAYSRTTDGEGKPISRLIGMSLYKANSSHTGRHWWGVNRSSSRGGFNQPMSGPATDELAEKLGFTAYKNGETGTSVMVISPSFHRHNGASFESLKSSENRYPFAQAIQEALQIWYWPRMMGSGERNGCLVCSVTCDGEQVKSQDPSERTPLDLYTIAFSEIQKAIANPGHKTDPQVILKYIKRNADEGYGYLAVHKSTKRERAEWASQKITENHPIAGALWPQNNNSASCNSVALIRSAGQVVRYFPTASSPLPSNEYGAVFYLHPTGAEAKRIFDEIKASEPASHDNWSPGNSAMAKYLISRIRGEMQALIAPNVQAANGNSGRLGRIAIMLGSLWGEGEGAGGNTTPSTPSSTTGNSSKGSARYEPRLAMIGGEPCIVLKFLPKMRMPDECKGLVVETKARALGGTAMHLDEEDESGAANVMTEEDSGAGTFVGWFTKDPCDGNQKAICADSEISVEMITTEMKKEGFYAVIKNARTFGLSIETKFLV